MGFSSQGVCELHISPLALPIPSNWAVLFDALRSILLAASSNHCNLSNHLYATKRCSHTLRTYAITIFSFLMQATKLLLGHSSIHFSSGNTRNLLT